jgi:hypothetical protein
MTISTRAICIMLGVSQTSEAQATLWEEKKNVGSNIAMAFPAKSLAAARASETGGDLRRLVGQSFDKKTQIVWAIACQRLPCKAEKRHHTHPRRETVLRPGSVELCVEKYHTILSVSHALTKTA